jgi:hypothetical protein
VLRDKLPAPLTDKVPIVAGARGTVVTVTEFDAALAAEVPISLEAVTVIVVTTPVPKPVIVKGEDEPVAVCITPCTLQYPDAVNEVAYESAGVKVTDIAPLLWGRAVPTSVAVPIVGALGTTFLEECVIPTTGIIEPYRRQVPSC